MPRVTVDELSTAMVLVVCMFPFLFLGAVWLMGRSQELKDVTHDAIESNKQHLDARDQRMSEEEQRKEDAGVAMRRHYAKRQQEGE